jgi:hypothetical protein
MADVERTPFKQRMQMAGVIAGAAFTFNSLFWIASHFYFADKPLEVASIDNVRFAFFIMSAMVAVMAYGAALAPRFNGHLIAAVMGIAALVGGIAALGKGMPPVMGATMLLVGIITIPLVYLSLQRSRSAWSFLIAIVAVFGAVTFFGSPKVAHILGIGLWYAMVIPGLQVVCVIALSMLRAEYRE